jgi:hypothetical protein
MAEASSKGVIDDNLQTVLQAFAASKRQAAQDRKTNEAVAWLRPPLNGWTGGMQTESALVDLHKAFNTDLAENALITAFNPASPGVNADIVLSTLQIDYMAQAERAYRARISQSFIRSLAHVSAREKGHGDNSNGVFIGQVLNYFIDIKKQSS